jgi:membrane-associated phospholipid phosphatase
MGADTAQIEAPGTGRSQIALSHRHVGAETSPAPLLEPAPAGPAARFAQAVGETHPVRVFLAAALGGYVLLVGLMVALGFLLTKVLLRSHGLSARDEHISAWLARHRTPTLVDLSWLGSTLAGGLVIPVVVGVLLLAFVLAHRWRLAAFTLFVICIESGAYRATSLVVHRDRPQVHRLESLPVDASYPSGHAAASVALYGGLLLVLASRLESAALRVLIFALAVAIPAFVVWSRLLRGMHHATDTAAGVVMGLLAVAITVFAARAAGAAAAARDAREAGS